MIGYFVTFWDVMPSTAVWPARPVCSSAIGITTLCICQCFPIVIGCWTFCYMNNCRTDVKITKSSGLFIGSSRTVMFDLYRFILKSCFDVHFSLSQIPQSAPHPNFHSQVLCPVYPNTLLPLPCLKDFCLKSRPKITYALEITV